MAIGLGINMKKAIIIGAAMMAAISLSSSGANAAVAPVVPPAGGGGSLNLTVPWIVGGCAAGIILAAAVANSRDNRELAAPEAWTCGLLFWFERPTEKKPAHHARHR